MSVRPFTTLPKTKKLKNYRLALIWSILITPNSMIQTISTPIPLSTSRWERGQPFLITFLSDSMAIVKGKHLAMIRRPIGMPSKGHTRPLIKIEKN